MAKGHSLLFAVSAVTKLISLSFLCLLLLPPVYAQDRRDEVLALQEFSAGYFGAGYWITWNYSDTNACAWAGVTCTINYTVAELNLSGWISGAGPYQLSLLSGLRDLHRLDLSSNNLGVSGLFSFSVPDDIGTLTALTWLDYSQNNLVGEIPANLSLCRRLRFLSLEQNRFEGPIPSTLSDLKDLQFLFLADNQLSGPFPTELTELSSLVSIDLSHNSFTGVIPALPNLTKLVSLKLDNNSFTLGFTKLEDSWFSTVSQSLEVLSVSFNQLEGVLPSNITLPNLQLFNMSGNRLSGHVSSFFTVSYTISIDLSQNQLTGEIPSDLIRHSLVPSPILPCDSLNFSYNLLTGSIPMLEMCFQILDLSHNNLSGNLSGLLLENNSTVANFPGLTNLWLGHNHLSGDFVDFLSNSPPWNWVTDLRVESNLFTGDLSKLTSAFFPFLQVMDLTDNHFQWTVSQGITDPITATLKNFTGQTYLREFYVGGNNFLGTSLPTTCFICNSSYTLQVLDLSGSHLEGDILSTAFNSACLSSLHFLNLSNNDIFGFLPDSIVLLPNLDTLDVSSNNLSGHLPLLLSNSTTRLDNPRFFEGNNGLCGYPLTSCPQDVQGKGVQWWVFFLSIGGIAMIALGSVLVVTWRWSVYHKRHQQDADLIKTLLEREFATIMPLRELKKATNNFAQRAQIGEGGFGTVYSQLNNGTMVAIKKSKSEGSLKDKDQFLNEVRILSQVNHRNLVKLLGCCLENKIAMLVFEFISNGTLQEHLCGKIGGAPLTWKQRVNIVMQTADALNYLHSAVMFPIYHRDVKSTNILLDNNFNAKVADFGISKLAPLQATHVSTIAVQGTIGYIDPEYYTSYHLTDKSDVFSFGVVLLELISAKRVVDCNRGEDYTSLVYLSSPCIEREDLHGLIDPTLLETYNEVVGSGKKSIIRLGKLAMRCLEMQSKARPSMNEVWKELQNLWAELEGVSMHLEDSINKDDEDFIHDHRVLHSEFVCKDSSTFAMQNDGHSIEMSQFVGSSSLRSTSIR